MSDPCVSQIARPGEVLESVGLRDLLKFDESSPIAIEWRKWMQDIESRTVRPRNV